MKKIENVRIVNHDSIIENATIIIDNKKIIEITESKGKANKTIIPGFIEIHIHGFANKECNNGKQDIEYMSKELAKVGVTSFMPTIMTDDWNKIIEILKSSNDVKTVGAKIAGFHMEGPFFSIAKKGAQNPKYIIKATKEKIDQLWEASNHKIKRIGIAPEENNIDLIKYITDLGMIANIGHTNGSAEDVFKSSQFGATAATHLWNGMSGVSNRKPGIVQGVLMDDKIYAELICDFVHVDPLTIKFSIKNKGVDRIIAVSDSVGPAGMPDGEYTSGNLPVVKKGDQIRLLSDGNIAGGASSIDLSFKNLLSLNYSLQDVVKMTSYNAAQNNGLDDVGEIKPNKKADFIIIDENNKIEDVYIDGEKI